MAQSEAVTLATTALQSLLEGGIPACVEAPEDSEGGERLLVAAVNQFVGFMAEVREFVLPLSSGELGNAAFTPDNYLASPLREFQSQLRHLTWQAQQVASGDYAQRVDFMGDFATAFNAMVEALDVQRGELQLRIAQLEDALAQVKQLEGLLPTCANCRQVRSADATGEARWDPLERYVTERTDARFSHTICPDCMRELYPEYVDRLAPGASVRS